MVGTHTIGITYSNSVKVIQYVCLSKFIAQLYFTSREACQMRASLLQRTVDGVSDVSVLSKARLMSAMLMTGSWAIEVRSQCDSASG